MNLMDLPIERRLRIYELALVEKTAICIDRGWQRPSLLALGPKFVDHDIVAETFFKRNRFVYDLTAYNFSEPDLRDLMQTCRQLRPREQVLVRKVDIMSFWTAKGITMQYIRKKVEDEMKTQGIRFEEDVVDFCTRMMSGSVRWPDRLLVYVSCSPAD
jgi:hypothetical protein